MRFHKYIALIAFSACIFVLQGCSSRQNVEYQYVFPASIWNRFVPVIDTFSVSDAEKAYDLDISFSVWDNFEHSLIPLQIIITYPDGQESVFVKYVSVRDIEGKHLGEAKGDVWTISTNVLLNRTFPAQGDYVINIQNLTQYYDLPNVHAVAYRLYPHKQ
ncbi:MAG: hypothetical protein J6Y47_08575 [Bacteroidales bacterium]|nr:hypothetical protein [Bacteroidales bacterium]